MKVQNIFSKKNPANVNSQKQKGITFKRNASVDLLNNVIMAQTNPTVREEVHGILEKGFLNGCNHASDFFFKKMDKILKENEPEQINNFIFEFLQNHRVKVSVNNYTERVARAKSMIIQKVLGDSELSADSKVLDIGYGSGKVTEKIQHNMGLAKDHILGIDIFEPQRPFSFETGKFDGENIPAQDGIYDKVFLLGVLHHSKDPKKLLMETNRVVKPHGKIIVQDFDNPTMEDGLKHFLVDLFSFGTSCFDYSYKGCQDWLNMMEESNLKIQKVNVSHNDLNSFFAVAEKI